MVVPGEETDDDPLGLSPSTQKATSEERARRGRAGDVLESWALRLACAQSVRLVQRLSVSEELSFMSPLGYVPGVRISKRE